MTHKLMLRGLLIVIGLLLTVCKCTSAQEAAIVDAPEVIKAGEVLNFTIRLDKAPNFDGGVVQFSVVGPDTEIGTSSSPFVAGQRDCHVGFRIPAAATGGKWHLRINGFFIETRQLPLKSADITFQVIANENLVFPSSAEVRINPSQVQLFRTSATKLQLQVQEFKASLASHEASPTGSVTTIVRKNIGSAIEAVNATQSSFHNLEGSAKQPIAEQIFFDDLRASYARVLAKLNSGSLRSGFVAPQHSASVREVAQRMKPEIDNAMMAEAALRPFEQNELAYKAVADAQSLTFDLTVKSSPAGAGVCYHRHGDPCRPNPDATNTTIMSLPYAIWLVQFQKEGYATKEVEHDPFREPNHVIDVELRR
jgi:hypothetical protein